MLIKLLFLLGVYGSFLFADLSALKKLPMRGWAAYSLVLALSAYLGTRYLFDLKWPFLEETAASILGEPGKHIVEFLKPPD